MPRRAKVHVSIYDECDVDCEVANVSIDEEDEIVWHSTAGPFTVVFEDSPFTAHTFPVPAGGDAHSGAARKDALKVTYHYTIAAVGSMAKASDPDVNVKH